jgi:aspartate 1-decarboxylase
MRRIVLKSKLHRATVTETNLDYEGSLSIDTDLLDEADIVPFEQIHVWDVTNGNRLITYALPGERGSGVIQVNGGGAHLIKKGDIVIIATFTEMKTKDTKKYKPVVVFLDPANKPKAHDAVAEPAAETPTVAAKADTPKQRPTVRKKRNSSPT